MSWDYFFLKIYYDMTVMGIDPSINCTGVCVVSNNLCKYILIPSKMTKRMKIFQNDYIDLKPYNKEDYKNEEYELKELIKTNNIYNICNIIDQLIIDYKPDHINMEGISYGSVGSAALADLSGLNFAIRGVFIKNNIPFTIVPPTKLKKFAVANGSADKDLMIYAWKTLQPHLKNINDIKVDDLADAYFLAQYKNNP